MSSPAEIKAVLRRGWVDPDECSGSLAAVRAAAEQSGSQEMNMLAKHALGGWSRHTHVLYTAPVQEAVVATLLAANRIDNDAAGADAAGEDAAGEDAAGEDVTAAVCGPSFVSLPPEMWEEIFHFLARSQWFTRVNAIVPPRTPLLTPLPPPHTAGGSGVRAAPPQVVHVDVVVDTTKCCMLF
jgi:hypothetical protein